LFNTPHSDDSSRWDDFFSQVGAMTMGATTYEWALDHDGLLEQPDKWHDYYADVPCWVFSSRELPQIPGADLRFVRGNVAPVHAEMSNVAGHKNIWIVGGGELVGQFHDAGLLDEIHVSLAPVVLGAGAPLLPRRVEGMRVESLSQDGERVNITYRIRG
jgi:dihydrofolate reductase